MNKIAAISSRIAGKNKNVFRHSLVTALGSVFSDRLLANHRWLAGDDFSIADIAHFGWLRNTNYAGITLEDAPNLQLWVKNVAERPAVQRGLAALA
ncbi:MAG: glutathione S-transferase family protein [Methylomicrobium sp.]|nr:glutathione S-transferase family protein [Methylomicrobium sp.]